MGRSGALAEWLGTGLQNLVHRFDSGRRLAREQAKNRMIKRFHGCHRLSCTSALIGSHGLGEGKDWPALASGAGGVAGPDARVWGVDRVLISPLALRDIDDVERYVGRFVRELAIEGEDARDAIMCGVEWLVLSERDLPDGVSLRNTAGGIRLRDRLKDWRKAQRRQAGHIDVGLSWEVDAARAEPAATYMCDPAEIVPARDVAAGLTTFAAARSKAAIGAALRKAGVPSFVEGVRPGTAAAEEIAATAADEQRTTFILH
jgi:hypothetical protein